MIDGADLWGTEVAGDLIETEVSSGIVKTFPGLPENLFEAMKKAAAVYPEKTALVDDAGETCSYQCFLEMCEEFAAYLYSRKGIRAGSHVGIMMHNTIEYCVAFYALSRIGAVMISLPSKFRRAEVLALAEQARMEFVICEAEYQDWFEGFCASDRIIVPEKADGGSGYEWMLAEWSTKSQDRQKMEQVASGTKDAPTIMMFTSGTTSQSKGVLLKNRQVMHAVEAYRRILQITEKDISVIATPIYHITGLVALMGLFLSTGGTLHLHRMFQAERVLRDAQTFGFTFLHASPTVFHLLLQAGEEKPEIPSLRSFACGSSHMAKEKILRLHQWLPHAKFYTVYGLTETSSPATIFPDDAAQSPYIGASGKPIPGTCFKIVDDDNRELPQGTVGEIAIKGANILEEYYGEQKGRLQDGWLYTGDLGYFNEEQYLYVVDRKKNMINRGGEKIWCYDVENEMETMPEIRNAGVVGIPDELYGESAAAAVELKSGSTLSEQKIKDYLKTRMATYKIPVKIKVVEKLPQTANGKPDKAAIKKMMAEE